MDIVCFLSVPSVVCNLIVLQGLQFEIAQFRGPLRENTLGSAYLDACEWPLTLMQSFFVLQQLQPLAICASPPTCPLN